MGKRVPKSVEMRKRLKEILLGQKTEDISDLFGNLILHAAGIVVQKLLEAECEEFLGRPYYSRGQKGARAKGYRNGYRPLRIKTAEGLLTCDLPKVRGTEKPYRASPKRESSKSYFLF